MKQPDFTQLFFDMLGGKPKRIRYEVRDGACREHDIKFLDSLLHDANFRLGDISQSSNMVRINIRRDCWELGRISGDQQLLVTESALTFSKVKTVSWTTESIEETKSNEWLEINDIYVGESSYHHKNIFEIVLSGYRNSWQLRVTLAGEKWRINLKDKSSPMCAPLGWYETP
jgi:hypothetical protein